MRQSRLMSLTEAAANIMVGYAWAYSRRRWYSRFSGSRLRSGRIWSWPRFTAVSFVSSYALRGICEHV